eukprot:m.267100 g.267100  ORF g.267100 m.267100 type:complete len:182 (-) comp17636_c0_seq1:6002-6547(-)
MAFEFPWEYSFPPFFTLQPNDETRDKQLSTWSDLILSYTKAKKIERFVVSELLTTELFQNRSINRSLNQEAALAVLDFMAENGNIEYQDAGKESCIVFWRAPQQWAALLYQWACDTGHLDTVCTFYELREGEYAEGQEFFGLDPVILRKAIAVLQTQGKGELVQMNDQPNDAEDGVKFFSG